MAKGHKTGGRQKDTPNKGGRPSKYSQAVAEEICCRAAAEAQAYHNQHPSLLRGHIVLQMDRERVSGVKLEARPQSTPTTGTPKAEPEQREITVIRD
jgi:hypothetical protein